MRIERNPCPRCNSPLTKAPHRHYLANGTIRLTSSCTKCHYKFTVGITTEKLDKLEKELESATQKLHQGSVDQDVVFNIHKRIVEEKEKHGIQ